jgi:hypothetical protein
MKKIIILFVFIFAAWQVQSQQNQNPTQNVCEGSTSNYNVTTTLTGSSFAWSITPSSGGSIINGQGTNNIDITWGTIPGIYTVQVIETSSGNCPGAAKTVAVTVIAAPTANAGTNQTICAIAGTAINLSGTVSNATSQSWTTTATGTFTGTTTLTPVYTITAADVTAGSVTFTLTATGNTPCSNATSTVTYTINAAPTLTVGNNGPICEGNTLNLTSSIAGATYNWTGPNGYTATSQNPTVSTSATTVMSGTYSLTVSGISGGCPNLSGTTSVTVNPVPPTSLIWHD